MKIAFCKFAGLASGGTEKYLQSIALLYNKHADIDYYYTNAAPIAGSSWVHPDNSQDRIDLLRSNGINLIPVQVGLRQDDNWLNTNFKQVFVEDGYECLVTAGDGRSEYPYNTLNKIPIIHTIHGTHAYDKPNIIKSVLISSWQAEQWISNGGNSTKMVVIPPIVYIPSQYPKDLRTKLGIPQDAVVFGLHQARGVGSLESMVAFQHISKDNCYYVILGGSDIHKQHASANNVKNVFFLDHTASLDIIHEFLDGIDIYAHCRNDGEVCSASIIEAMAHSKPVITCTGNGPNFGHLEQVDSCGIITDNVDQYIEAMRSAMDIGYRTELIEKTKIRYRTTYDYNIVQSRLLQLVQ